MTCIACGILTVSLLYRERYTGGRFCIIFNRQDRHTVVASSFAPLILVSPPLFVLPYLPYKNEGFQNIAFFSALHNLFISRVNEECNKTVGANLVSGYLIRVKYR